MKQLVVLSLAILVVAMTGCGSSAMLVGAWEMEGAGENPPVKILSDTHFSFGGPNPDGSMHGGGGTYVLEGDSYTEVIAYHSIPPLVGKTVEFECRVEGDRWFHKADFEAEGRKFHIDEVWRRVRPSR